MGRQLWGLSWLQPFPIVDDKPPSTNGPDLDGWPPAWVSNRHVDEPSHQLRSRGGHAGCGSISHHFRPGPFAPPPGPEGINALLLILRTIPRAALPLILATL